MEKTFCNSCKKSITNNPGSTKFKCPKCTKTEIVRCTSCRINATHYHCHECGFEGPN